MSMRFLISACFGLIALPALAQETPTVLVYDQNRILEDSQIVSDLQDELREGMTLINAAHNTAMDRLEADFERIEVNKQNMPTRDYERAKSDFDVQAQTISRQTAENQQELEADLEAATKTLQENVIRIAAEIAAERGAIAAVPRAGALYVSDDGNLDITNSLIERLDASASISN